MDTTDTDPRLKRLRYRAWHRGFREMDLLLGAFADARLEALAPAEVDAFEALLDAPDWDLYAWITATKPVPDSWDGPVLRLIIDHAHARPRP